MGKRG